jgi:hypothetical protein
MNVDVEPELSTEVPIAEAPSSEGDAPFIIEDVLSRLKAPVLGAVAAMVAAALIAETVGLLLRRNKR